jgi:hypothetical protein
MQSSSVLLSSSTRCRRVCSELTCVPFILWSGLSVESWELGIGDCWAVPLPTLSCVFEKKKRKEVLITVKGSGQAIIPHLRFLLIPFGCLFWCLHFSRHFTKWINFKICNPCYFILLFPFVCMWCREEAHTLGQHPLYIVWKTISPMLSLLLGLLMLRFS